MNNKDGDNILTHCLGSQNQNGGPSPKITLLGYLESLCSLQTDPPSAITHRWVSETPVCSLCCYMFSSGHQHKSGSQERSTERVEISAYIRYSRFISTFPPNVSQNW